MVQPITIRFKATFKTYAQAYLESEHPNATAMCTIGCGADANPQRDSEKALSIAKAQGKQIADEIKTLLTTDRWRPIKTASVTTFGFAGPGLDALESKDRGYILKSILDPNAAVEWKYKSYNFITVDGRMINGLVTQASATSVTLALPDGKNESLLLSEIEDMKNSSKSFMPDGFERSLTVEQMAHLLEFLKPSKE